MPDYRADPSLQLFYKDVGASFAGAPEAAGENALYKGTRLIVNAAKYPPGQLDIWAQEAADIDALIGSFNALTMQGHNAQALKPPPSVNVAANGGLQKYGAIAVFYARQYHISPLLFLSQIQHESNWNPRAVSPVGAQGLGQVMPATGRGVGLRDPFDPTQNLEASCKVDIGNYDTLRQISKIDAADKDSYMLAAYNAGAGGVAKAIRKARQSNNIAANVPLPYRYAEPFLPSETRNYVKLILRDTGLYVTFVNSVR